MKKNPDGTLMIDGECELCGLPGIIGMTCSECGGTIINLNEPKATVKDEGDEDGRYSDDLMDETKTVSLEDLAEDEVTADDADDETL